ncbi:hypothetical protein [Microbacterium arborescens]|nr:hypothetical protein [Microbacterium arborescens]
MTVTDCGHTRAQHCTCPPCVTACAERQAEDLIPIVWPAPRAAVDDTTT